MIQISLWTLLTPPEPTGFCSADQLVMPGEVSGVRGKSVNFTATVPPSIEVETVTWSFIPKSGGSVPVYTATEVKEKVSDAYMGRVTYYRNMSTLQLNTLTAADGGRYTLTIVDSNLNQLVGQTALVVLGRLHQNNLFHIFLQKLHICFFILVNSSTSYIVLDFS